MVLILPLLAATAVATLPQRFVVLDSLVAAERAFAAASVELGTRASFLRFFADSCVAFSPAPCIYREAVAKLPPPSDPLARTLDWEPVEADVALSGDMGYTTGPFSLTDHTREGSPVRYGFYFSVWKRQSDSTWKIIVDIGSESGDETRRWLQTRERDTRFARCSTTAHVLSGMVPAYSSARNRSWRR
jgi:ketosteroid isomerase-like protein